jgi:signal transduction histidine kinase
MEGLIMEFFPPNSIIAIYLVYGLAFFSLGLTVALEAQRSASRLDFARAMLPLAVFGLLHGAHEWLEMLIRDVELHNIGVLPTWVEILRVGMLSVSFASLMVFALKLRYPRKMPLKSELSIGGGMFLLWIVTVLVMAVIIHPGDAMRLTVRSWLRMTDTWSRYSLAIPGALLSSYALWQYARDLPPEHRYFSRHLYRASVIFFVYGTVGQFFVEQTYLYPSQIINAELFEDVVGVPVQLIRAVLAVALAFTLIPALNMFEVERQQALANAEQRVRDELARREALRREMLKHTVDAQEEERRRIARELHDEIGQTLTALSLGLGGVEQLVSSEPDQAKSKLKDLHNLMVEAVSGLSNLVTDLRPSQLDHLGLAAALRSVSQDYKKRFDLQVRLDFVGKRRRLPSDIELGVFRIAQESLTNVVRHSGTKQADVRLSFLLDEVELCICDKGTGFIVADAQDDERKHWGLLGMEERATQLNGTLIVDSELGQGTNVVARFPLPQEKTEVKSSD